MADLKDRKLFSDNFFYNLVSTIDHSIIIIDNNGKIVYYNKASKKIFKYLPDEIAGESINKIIPQFSMKINTAEGKLIEAAGINRDGYKLTIELSVAKFLIKNKFFYALLLKNISKRKVAEEKLKFLSFHDKLTKLYNRSYFEVELRRLNTPRQLPLSIIIGDIDGFKLVNDAFGYKQGDELLKEFAKLIKESCRTEDILARWGGDEFVILLPKTEKESVMEIISRIQKNTAHAKQKEIPLNISLGYAIKNQHNESIDEVIKKAEDLMKQNKLRQSKKVSSAIISSIRRSLREKSKSSEIISSRIKKLAVDFGKFLKLSKNELERLSLLAEFYDAGKVILKKGIFKKKTELKEDEWQIVKMHPEVGYRIAKSSINLAQIADDILSHHENWDGSGYPYGLNGNDIPLNSRIISIVEAYDVMVHGRIYKEPVEKEKALQELRMQAKKQFDPKLVSKFINMIQQQDSYLSLFQ